MKKLTLILLTTLFFIQFASADIYITEIMHSPNQMAHSDGEWVELYNSGDTAVNLSNYTLDGNEFDDITIQPNEYIVVARELLDGEDADNDSFESYWGNNNGIWDESFNAVDGSLSLSAEDTIILTNGFYTEQVDYNESFGGTNGRTTERLSLNEWQESGLDGTPGNGSFTTQEESSGDLEVFVTVSNSEPNITSLTWLTDDSLDEGIQILPNVELPKEISLNLEYEDAENDVTSITLEVNNQLYNFTDGNLSFSMQHYDLAQSYEVNITVCDDQACDSITDTFEYLGMISTTLNTSSLNFDLKVNEQQETTVQVINSGNVVVDVELGGTDLVSNNYNISIENLEVYNEDWFSLNTNPTLDIDILPNTNEDLLLRLTVPSETQPGEYNGVITITSMESS